MKFSEIASDQWEELQPYLDTCLLPVTGLTGKESPYEATLALEQLRDWMDEVEVPFKGRMVTYPAFHYADEKDCERVNAFCQHLKEGGFTYVVLISAQLSLTDEMVKNADLALSPATVIPSEEEDISHIMTRKIQQLWHKNV
ncbi:DUF2487 family protein [Paenibacillus sp. GCM10027629]|uniref:DUF2487 family protein n=1 Tax=Paenibacillus sp. GCM10027629 TaxID=3273414 RepID=UPI00362F38DF